MKRRWLRARMRGHAVQANQEARFVEIRIGPYGPTVNAGLESFDSATWFLIKRLYDSCCD